MRWNCRVGRVLFIVLVAGLGVAQVHEFTPVPLEELRMAKTPDEIRTGPPWRCDSDGRAYARVRSWRGLQVARFDSHAVPDLFFPSDSSTSALKEFRIIDFNTEPNGGIYALVGRITSSGAGPKFRIAFIDSQGAFRNFVDPVNVVPQKVAVFENGDLLISGFTPASSGASSESRFTGVFRPDGRLQTRLRLDFSTAFSDSKNTDKQEVAAVKANDVENSVDFISSPNGNIYAAAIGSVDSANLTAQNQVIEITPSGDVHSYRIVDNKDQQLFHLVIGTNEILALSATRAGDNIDVRDYYLDQSKHSLLMTGRYRVLGMPLCAATEGLLVMRPDGKGHQYLVTYKR